MPLPEDLQTAIQAYLEGNATDDQQQLVNTWYASFDDSSIEIPDSRQAVQSRIGQRLQQTLAIPLAGGRVVPMRRKIARVASAAAVLLLLCGTAWYFLQPHDKPTIAAHTSHYHNDIPAPAGNKATLTLGNGQQIALFDTNNDSLTALGVPALRSGDTALTYDHHNTTLAYNTLTNPRGSTIIHLTLPDGSDVWLNASSAITFPTAFTASYREVSITGEAYLEVKHNARQPFRVKAGNQVIEDVGTAFNVNAYPDEATVKTTLVSGAVKVGNVLLKPGQQWNGSRLLFVDTDQETAWKNGLFSFDHNNVATIMKQLSRWYDLDVEYQGTTNETYTLSVNKSLPISKLLAFMEKSGGIHFDIHGNKVIVKP